MAIFKRADRGNIFKESAQLELNEGVSIETLGRDKYCKSVVISGPGSLVNKDGELIEDNSLKTGQKGTLSLGELNVGQYHVMLEPNPEFVKQCQVRGPRLLEPRDRIELSYVIKADVPTSLNDLDYLFRLYIID